MLFITRSSKWLAAVTVSAALLHARAAIAQPATTHAQAEAQEAAHEAQQAEAAGDPNPLAFRTDLALWTLVVFLLLFWFLKRFAWPQIAEAIDERERKIAEEIRAAAEKHEQAKQLLADHEARLAATAGEIRALLDEARRDAENTKAAIVAEARKETENERKRAVIEIERAKEGAIHDLALATANVAIDLAKEVTRKDLSTERNNELIRDAMNKLAAAQPSKN